MVVLRLKIGLAGTETWRLNHLLCPVSDLRQAGALFYSLGDDLSFFFYWYWESKGFKHAEQALEH